MVHLEPVKVIDAWAGWPAETSGEAGITHGVAHVSAGSAHRGSWRRCPRPRTGTTAQTKPAGVASCAVASCALASCAGTYEQPEGQRPARSQPPILAPTPGKYPAVCPSCSALAGPGLGRARH